MILWDLLLARDYRPGPTDQQWGSQAFTGIKQEICITSSMIPSYFHSCATGPESALYNIHTAHLCIISRPFKYFGILCSVFCSLTPVQYYILNYFSFAGTAKKKHWDILRPKSVCFLHWKSGFEIAFKKIHHKVVILQDKVSGYKE